MKTEHKYISYRPDKDTYIVSLRVDGKKTYFTCHSLEEAIKKRDSLVELHNLDKKIVSSLSTERIVKAIPTLEEAFTEFVEKDVRPRVALSTYSKYNLCKSNYCKQLGSIRIDRISHEAWQRLFSARQEENHYSKGYVMDDVRRFRAMYEYFISLGVITSNPFDNPIKLQNTHKVRRRGFTEQEKERFLATAKEYDNQWFVIFSLYFATGARRAELLALRWQDIDVSNKSICIRRSITRGTMDGVYREIVGNTKTVCSVRDIPVSEEMLSMILSLQKEDFKPSDYVFTANKLPKKYEHMSLSNTERVFRRIAQKAKLDKCLSIHCIRHYVASKLITNGVDLSTVQSIGGWKNPNVLLAVYAHSNEEAKRKALEKVIF